MTTLTTYLLFDGKCQQAMEFYKYCFGGELTVTEVKDTPAKGSHAAVLHGKIINARLRSSNLEISASDWLRNDRTPIRGNTVCLYLSGGTLEELKALFERLLRGRRRYRSTERAIFRCVRSTQRQIWCPMDVSNRQKGLSQTVVRWTKQHRSERHEIHFADVGHEGRR